MTQETDSPLLAADMVRYIEKLALGLTEMGWPRMPARVFAALQVSDEGRLTAAELARILSISPAAISGAVRYLDQVGVVTKVRLPGQRRDHYQLYDDLWYASFLKRDRMLKMWAENADEGIELVGQDTKAGRRLAEMRDFFEFFVTELPLLFDRWHEQRNAQRS
ncbi:GbsR/MarR family transcriptional regulator [Nocardia donostiensis]|uniref:MarR family transcriptional regulator n=1 Tax=Nocardia donostiensis TaxID=1538463 RepID=A0A1V2TH14_9NOCA|nr:MarR family transcriptional regulator [Nocardia donostiensis]ONM48800.1 MarR family transcriptional regulator [Nocardia donostiensis]OQS13000.1 MarR family transcriptional regulator [Nocardia donostiensis]OQS22945.1 MarR family transcriptional regulator [Nocardia donostiensis]